MSDRISEIIQESISCKQILLQDQEIIKEIKKVVSLCIQTIQNNGKILLCGNGGSAADAQHLAAELTGRFYKDRPPIYADALHTDTSYLTAVANDFGYAHIFARQVEAKGQPGDILILLSTSGNSQNIVAAAKKGKEMGLKTIGFTGESGGSLSKICDFQFRVPSTATPRIQECHILIGHILCELIEAQLFGE